MRRKSGLAGVITLTPSAQDCLIPEDYATAYVRARRVWLTLRDTPQRLPDGILQEATIICKHPCQPLATTAVE